MALIDLSQPFSDGMYHSRLFPRPKLESLLRIEEAGCNVTQASFAVHVGTHVDAPTHFIPHGRTIEKVQLDEVAGAAVCISVERGAREQITVEDLRTGPSIRDGDILFVRTGWSRFFADHERYRQYPYLSVEAAQWLLDRRIKMLALDCPSPDMPEGNRPEGFSWPVHHLLLGNDVLIAENLTNLDQIAGRRFRALALPIAMVGADGAPARIVADV